MSGTGRIACFVHMFLAREFTFTCLGTEAGKEAVVYWFHDVSAPIEQMMEVFIKFTS